MRCKKNPQIPAPNKYGNAAIFIFNYSFFRGGGGAKFEPPITKYEIRPRKISVVRSGNPIFSIIHGHLQAVVHLYNINMLISSQENCHILPEWRKCLTNLSGITRPCACPTLLHTVAFYHFDSLKAFGYRPETPNALIYDHGSTCLAHLANVYH